ncbi:cytochrome c biogenesis protein CcmG, thiol:disulfide interchange protein DsbE [Gammaproteobacteria bacterium]
MKKFIHNFFFVLFLLGGMWQPALALVEGEAAPPFAAETLDGSRLTLANLQGNVIIVHFWATWCSSCREEMPILDVYYQKYREKGLRVLSVSIDDEQDDSLVRSLAQKYSFPAAFNRNSDFKNYGRIWYVPMNFIIDRAGILRKDGGGGERLKITLPILEQYVTPLLIR